MRWVGIDYGKKRIGLALSDPDGRMAFPLRVIGRPAAVRALKELVHREKVGAAVVGLPAGFAGEAEVRNFGRRLKKALGRPVYFENEMFTTRMAEAHDKGPLSDSSAAAIILQSFLDKIQMSKSK